MTLLAHDTLSFHLLNDTRGAVIANTELTLHPGYGSLAFLRHKVDGLIEQRIELFTALVATAAAFAFAIGGDAIDILRTPARLPVLNDGVNFLVAYKAPCTRTGIVELGAE